MLILGIDEAGRGPVIGPMIIAGIVFNKNDLNKLKVIGVKNSKIIKPKKRENLFNKILKISKEYCIIEISAKEIDKAVNSFKITKLEAIKIAKIINKLEANEVYIDSPVNNPRKFVQILSKEVKKNVKIICEIKADEKYLQVSAASIIAKVIRDKKIKKLHKKYGDFGSGYPTDPKTINFLKNAIKNKNIPIEVRKSWKIFKKMLNESLIKS